MQNLQMPFHLEQSPQTSEKLQIADADIQLFPHFLSVTKADLYFDEFKTQMPWQQDSLNFGGKSVLIPRLQVWVGDKHSHYAYSGLSLSPLPWTPVLEKLKKLVEKACNSEFNSVLLNYYRDGRDSVAWHSDDEKELGSEPIIASLSLGVSRRFQLKHKIKKHLKSSCELGNGSLLVMGKGVQQYWQHQVPKQAEVDTGRINLTFRRILG
ncbi:MAG: alkylated DNA repair dioxygenase AlkB [Pseudohongiellaceae bacterium]|jgi:alkylated DNA repair dioxygenase AlkB